MISPVMGSVTGCASVWPLRRLQISQLLVELVAADLADVVAAGIKEQSVQIALGAFDRGRLARTQAAVNLKQGFLTRLARVLVHAWP